jgi:hypothetical protein
VSGLGLTSVAPSMPSIRMPHPDQENRIFVGGIPYYLTEEQVGPGLRCCVYPMTQFYTQH